MAVFDPPYAGGGGMFPYAYGHINMAHPLAPNLAFLGVAYPGGYRDLVTRNRSSFSGNTPTFLKASGTPAGSGWYFGVGTTSSRATFTGLNCNPLSGMNMASACGFVNAEQVPSGAEYYLFTVLNPAGISNGGLSMTVFSTQPRVNIGSNGGTNNITASQVTTSLGQGESVVASNTNPNITIYTRTGSSVGGTASRTSASGISQVTFSSLSGAAQRSVIWGAVWTAPLTAAQAAMITPMRGALPPGLVIGGKWPPP